MNSNIFTQRKFLLFTFSFFLTLSGCSALIYQVVWVRLLGLSIGSTAASIGIVLAAFFFGLGLGSYFAGQLLYRFKHALKLYLVAEAVILCTALALLPVLLHLDQIISYFPLLGTIFLFKFALVLLLLAIPTFFIGLTFPLAVSATVSTPDEIAPILGRFYALNTVGALIGTLLAGFVLIPRFGLDGTIYIAAAGNLAIVILGTFLSRFLQTARPVRASTQPAGIFYSKILIILFVTGFCAMATEVGWMKYLIIYTGNTIYGYSMILAIFLAGLFIGSWASDNPLFIKNRPHQVLFWGLFLLGAALLLARSGLALFPDIYSAVNALELSPFMNRWSKYGVIFLLLFPATFLFGVLFPITLRAYCPDIERMNLQLGRAYGINIFAGLTGTLAASFIFIPSVGTDKLLYILAISIFLLTFLLLREMSPKIRFGGAVSIITFIILSPQLPAIDFSKMISIVLARENPHTPGQTPNSAPLFQKEGRTGIISVYLRYNNPCTLKLLNNGAPEAWFDICEQDNSAISEFLLGTLPHLLNPSAMSAFILGYGGGVSVQAVGASNLKKIDVVEIEPAVVDAVRHAYNGDMPTDHDSRITLRFDDARHALLTSSQTYDIIVSQPSHPWMSGGANIMSRDFFEIARSRLSEKGIYAQWLNLFRIDIKTFKSVLKAYTEVFPYTASFVNFESRDFLLFGSKSPIVFDFSSMQKGINHPYSQPIFQRYNITDPTGLMRYFALSGRQMIQLTKDSIPATDTNLLTEVFFSTYSQKEGNSFNLLPFLQKNCRYDLSPYLKEE